MDVLGNGLFATDRYGDALPVQEAKLSMERRLGASDAECLITQSNIAGIYLALRRTEEAGRVMRDVYSGFLKLNGEEHEQTLQAANNYVSTLLRLKRFEEARSLIRRSIPVARRVLGEGHRLTLKMRANYALALYKDPAATLDDLREAVRTLADAAPIVRRVFGGSHPLTVEIELSLRDVRARLRARETPSGSG
jgi:hypothetical protein